MVMMLGPPVGSCEYGNRNSFQTTGKVVRSPAACGGMTVRPMRRLERFSWDIHMAPSTNRSGREPFKLVMLGSNPAGVTTVTI